VGGWVGVYVSFSIKIEIGTVFFFARYRCVS